MTPRCSAPINFWNCRKGRRFLRFFSANEASWDPGKEMPLAKYILEKNGQSKAHKLKGLGTVFDVKDDQSVYLFSFLMELGSFISQCQGTQRAAGAPPPSPFTDEDHQRFKNRGIIKTNVSYHLAECDQNIFNYFPLKFPPWDDVTSGRCEAQKANKA